MEASADGSGRGAIPRYDCSNTDSAKCRIAARERLTGADLAAPGVDGGTFSGVLAASAILGRNMIRAIAPTPAAA
ncbi:MAG: hypothetical protein ABSF98_22895 [Bryobacteraceae bacterium]